MKMQLINRVFTACGIWAMSFWGTGVVNAQSPSIGPAASVIYSEEEGEDNIRAPQPSQEPEHPEGFASPGRGPAAVSVSSTPSYLSVPGVALQMGNSEAGNSYSTDGVGCLANEGDPQSYYVAMNLPDGTQVTSMRIYWHNIGNSIPIASHVSLGVITHTDTTAPGITAIEMRTELLVTIEATSPSTQGDGYWTRFTNLSAAHVVNNKVNSYVLRWDVQGTDRQALCAVRVFYYAPVSYLTYMPVVIK